MSDLIVEIRCEELPHEMIGPAENALATGLVELLDGVGYGGVITYSTPRRIAVVISDVATKQAEKEELVFGPSLSAARQSDEWTKAGIGFARSKGVEVSELQIVDGAKGQVIATVVKIGGEQTSEIIASGLERLIVGLPFKKSMRWGCGETRWGRPIHQVVAVFNGDIIQTTVADINTSNAVVGHRRDQTAPGIIHDKASYIEELRDRYVLVDRNERKEAIISDLHAKAGELGLEVVIDPELIEEVTDLVEWPVVVAGHFDEELLHLPDRLLVESMKVHQRTFPTYMDGDLRNSFLVVSNNPEGDPLIIGQGNSRVLRARFYDARFFYAEDKKMRLEDMVAKLEKMYWVKGLGTMAEKQARLAQQGSAIAQCLRLTDAIECATRAGALAKSDLASHMVCEFPKLQGYMGKLYAINQGEDGDVAIAIEEHYLPRYPGDALPTTKAGIALAIADRLDTLCGCFSINLVPKSNSDPQGLRRIANGLLTILLDNAYRVSLSELLQLASSSFNQKPAISDLLEFLFARFRSMMLYEGYRADIVDAVLRAGGDDVVQIRSRVRGLSNLSTSKDFVPLMTAFKRVLNISKDHNCSDYDRSCFEDESEYALADIYDAAAETIPRLVESAEVDSALHAMVGMKSAIDTYFDNVLVMTETILTRESRLGLLLAIANLFLSIADFRLIHANDTTSPQRLKNDGERL